MNVTTTTCVIPFQDLRRLHDSIAGELNVAIIEVMDRTAFVGAGACAGFEEAFAAAHGVEHAVGVGSGTDALALALRGLGIGPGDEVITTPISWVATSNVVLTVGAKPVFVDIDPVTRNIDLDKVEAAITPRTKASDRVSLVTSPRHSIQSPMRAGATNSEFRVIVATRSMSRRSPSIDPVASMAQAVSAESAKASRAPPWANSLALVWTGRTRMPATRWPRSPRK